VTYLPTLCFGLHKDYEKRIYQMWVDDLGNIDWRPLPLINMHEIKHHERPKRKPAEVYLVPDVDDGKDDTGG
jgi:hypothetical protein